MLRDLVLGAMAIVVGMVVGTSLMLSFHGMTLVLLGSSASTAVVLLVVQYCLRVMSASTSPPETVCRKCGYILKGLAEPRCPECGEQI